jgi:hypothetical protein
MMFVNYDPAWIDQTSGWWAKANRAKEHIDSLRLQVDEFRASGPYSLTPEPTETPGRLAYRLRYSMPIPVRISTTVGDALHNLRAALENLAFEIARRGVGEAMTTELEVASAFPIYQTPQAFDDFFKGRWERERKLIYDDRAREAFRAVQPFVHLEEVKKAGVAVERSFKEETRYADLHRLNKLWNIDKHRRLALMAWWPDLIYWTSNGPSSRKMFRGDGTLANGSVLFYIEGADDGRGSDVQHEFNLVLTDDPGFSREYGVTEDVVALTERWHQHIVNWVFPVMFTIMSRPIMRPSPNSP